MATSPEFMKLINEGNRLCCIVDDLQHRVITSKGLDKLALQCELRKAILRRDDIAASIAALGGIKGYEGFHDKEYTEITEMISEVFLRLIKEGK